MHDLAVPDAGRLRDPKRLEAVADTAMVDTPAVELFDNLASLASRLLGMPLAFTTFVDGERSYWKAAVGTGIDSEDIVSRANLVEESFCQYVILTDGPVIIPDATADPMTRDNPSVTSMGVRAWAGFPVRSADGHVLGSFCVVDTQPREFTELDLEVLAALAAAAEREVQLQQALGAARNAASAVDFQTVRATRLAAASDRLSDFLDAGQVLSALADIIVPELGSWLAVGLLGGVATADLAIAATGDPQQARIVAVTHRDPVSSATLADALIMLPLSADDARGIGAVIADRVPRHTPASSSAAGIKLAPDVFAVVWPLIAGDAALTLPLISRGRVLGGLTVGGPGPDDADHALLKQLAQRAATALDNALAYADSQRAVIDLQRSLMPLASRSLPGIDIAARYLPSTRGALVGGDFHQVITHGDFLVTAIGDIEGHGMTSAARMGQLRAVVAALTLEGHDPQTLLTRLAEQTHQILDIDLATLMVARLNTSTRELSIASAGHLPAVIAEDGRDPYLSPVDPGPPLGVGPATYVQHTQHLPNRSTLVLYSDGLVERRGEHLDIGLDTLRAAVGAAVSLNDSEAISGHLLAAMNSTHGGPDDIALLVIRT